jgi:hypothetical protein
MKLCVKGLVPIDPTNRDVPSSSVVELDVLADREQFLKELLLGV